MRLVQLFAYPHNYITRSNNLFKFRSFNFPAYTLSRVSSTTTTTNTTTASTTSTNTTNTAHTPLHLQFVSSRYSGDFKGVPHHLGLPTFNFLIHLYISQSSVVLKHVNSDTRTIPKSAASSKNLPKMRMHQSYVESILPLSLLHDPSRKRYLTVDGFLRLGPFLEDLDLFAGFIANEYCKQMYMRSANPLPFWFVVTGLVDRIKLNHFEDLPVDRDVKFRGCTTWVGGSTLEVSIQMQMARDLPGRSSSPTPEASITTGQLTNMYPAPDSILTTFYPDARPVIAPPPPGMQWSSILDAHFVMMARSAHDFSAFPMSELQLVTDAEREMFRAGDQRNRMRKKFLQESLLRTVPTGPEINEVHRMFLAGVRNTPRKRLEPNVLPNIAKDAVTIRDTRQQTNLICHPEERNLMNRIFGGYLMMQASELARYCANAHSARHVRLVAIDHFRFLRPVEMGTLLSLDSHVVFVTDAEGGETHLTVRVDANAVNLDDPELLAPCNTAYFVFAVDHPNRVADSGNFFSTPQSKKKSPSRIRRVAPDTYESAVMYLQGRRHYLQILPDLKHSTSIPLDALARV